MDDCPVDDRLLSTEHHTTAIAEKQSNATILQVANSFSSSPGPIQYMFGETMLIAEDYLVFIVMLYQGFINLFLKLPIYIHIYLW